jgi:hypothetical protein
LAVPLPDAMLAWPTAKTWLVVERSPGTRVSVFARVAA